MTRIQHLESRIEALEETVRQLTGRPRGPITMTEARLANERGDKATVQAYYDQFLKGGVDRLSGRESRPSGAGREIETVSDGRA